MVGLEPMKNTERWNQFVAGLNERKAQREADYQAQQQAKRTIREQEHQMEKEKVEMKIAVIKAAEERAKAEHKANKSRAVLLGYGQDPGDLPINERNREIHFRRVAAAQPEQPEQAPPPEFGEPELQPEPAPQPQVHQRPPAEVRQPEPAPLLQSIPAPGQVLFQDTSAISPITLPPNIRAAAQKFRSALETIPGFGEQPAQPGQPQQPETAPRVQAPPPHPAPRVQAPPPRPEIRKTRVHVPSPEPDKSDFPLPNEFISLKSLQGIAPAEPVGDLTRQQERKLVRMCLIQQEKFAKQQGLKYPPPGLRKGEVFDPWTQGKLNYMSEYGTIDSRYLDDPEIQLLWDQGYYGTHD
jgi:hypothetical protein